MIRHKCSQCQLSLCCVVASGLWLPAEQGVLHAVNIILAFRYRADEKMMDIELVHVI